MTFTVPPTAKFFEKINKVAKFFKKYWCGLTFVAFFAISVSGIFVSVLTGSAVQTKELLSYKDALTKLARTNCSVVDVKLHTPNNMIDLRFKYYTCVGKAETQDTKVWLPFEWNEQQAQNYVKTHYLDRSKIYQCYDGRKFGFGVYWNKPVAAQLWQDDNSTRSQYYTIAGGFMVLAGMFCIFVQTFVLRSEKEKQIQKSADV